MVLFPSPSFNSWWRKRYYDVNASHLPVSSPRTSSRTNRDKEIDSFLPVTALRIDYVASFLSRRRPLQRAVRSGLAFYRSSLLYEILHVYKLRDLYCC